MTRGAARILVAALALRLLVAASAWGTPTRFMVEEDSFEYLRITQNVVSGHGFSQAAGPPYTPDVRRTPLYPLVLSVLFTIDPDIVSAALFGVAVSSLSVLLLWRATAVLFGPRSAVLAALLLALDLTSAAYASQVLTEPFFTLLMLGSLFVLIVPVWRLTFPTPAAGLLAGLAALCRPIAVLLPVALVPAVAWRSRTGVRDRVWRGAILLLLPAALLMGAWTWRNHRVAGVTTLTSLAATNTYFHRAAYVAALREHRPVEDVRAEWEAELQARAGSWTEAERIAWLNARGRDLVVRHPLDYIVVALRGVARMLQPDAIVLPASLGIDPSSLAAPALQALGWLQLLVVYALAAAGLVRGAAARPRATLVPLAILVYFCVIGGPEMYPRFRVPLMPLFCMLAGVAAGVPEHES